MHMTLDRAAVAAMLTSAATLLGSGDIPDITDIDEPTLF